MTREELIRQIMRLSQGPVPTVHKKVYGYEGNVGNLVEALPAGITARIRVTDACDKNTVPDQAEMIRKYLQECVAARIELLRKDRPTSVTLVQEAVLLARYRVPLAFLYELTGDAHAIILHLEEGFRPREWKFPQYVQFDPEAPASYFEQALGAQFIREDRGVEARL